MSGRTIGTEAETGEGSFGELLDHFSARGGFLQMTTLMMAKFAGHGLSCLKARSWRTRVVNDLAPNQCRHALRPRQVTEGGAGRCAQRPTRSTIFDRPRAGPAPVLWPPTFARAGPRFPSFFGYSARPVSSSAVGRKRPYLIKPAPLKSAVGWLYSALDWGYAS
jgi:hypothetical protein